ncbi:TPA: DNA-binding protein [Candidatus Delongbacteria bacterium]|nr:DNA-binding protein [Candidatus Delongbacteria bacterium]
MKDIFAKRLKSARFVKGYSLQKLADMLNISKQMISKYESGKSLPDSTNLINIAKALGQSADYFFRPVTVELGAINFRKKSGLAIKNQKVVEEKILLRVENYLSIESILAIDSEFVNPLKGICADNIDKAAEASDVLRKKWELGHDPIHNVINLLEANRIKVIEIDDADDKFDGLSCIINNKFPVIVVNGNFNTERKRFTLLHELGHLVLNIPENIEDKEAERICHAFAGNMLIPSEILKREFGKSRDKITLQELKVFQKEFGMSIQAITYRLIECGIISKNSQKYFYMLLNTNPALKKDIDDQRFCGAEKSERFFRLIYKALSQELISIGKAASLLGESVSSVRKNFSVVID